MTRAPLARQSTDAGGRGAAAARYGYGAFIGVLVGAGLGFLPFLVLALVSL